ncbi:MAG: VWA domain-containing protein [Lachnospiraceae bacterium]|nr:VWA domain-containing protein [Lachnospiraceae bacterium]
MKSLMYGDRKTEMKGKKKIILFSIVLFLFIFPCITLNAQEINADETMDVIIVLDNSQSMTNVDSDYRASEFIKALTSILPGSYRTGLVAYNQEVCISLPPESSPEDIEQALQDISYRNYGNAGAGLSEAVSYLKKSRNKKKILVISDGENLMNSKESTEESVQLFEAALEEAKNQNITIDIINLGNRIEDSPNIYPAAAATGGKIYDLENGGELEAFAEKYLFEELKIESRPVGKISGNTGELKITLPDCLMEKAKIVLLGRQQNENIVSGCEAGKIQVLKGTGHTVLELENPVSGDITVQISSEESMNINAYLMAEYRYEAEAECEYLPDMEQVEIIISLKNKGGRSLLTGHLANGGLSVLLGGKECDYVIRDEKLIVNRSALQDETVELTLQFGDGFGIYYGEKNLKAEIILPKPEEEPETDWFFLSVIIIFAAALLLIFLMAVRKKKAPAAGKRMIEESRMLPKESGIRGNDFCGKLMVYVIHNRDDIDYPPESINLFARCSREVITLEWILDACNLPLNLKGAEKIVMKPGDDRSLIIKNNGVAAAMKGRELLVKGRSYHMYYHEKVTFIFDKEDTEIEVHYKDLKPNER